MTVHFNAKALLAAIYFQIVVRVDLVATSKVIVKKM